MKAEISIVKTLAAFALICGLSVSAQAQLGSGWTPDNETYIAQNSAGTSTTAIPGGFEFTTPSGQGRAEMRGNNLPTNITNQWQGFATLKSLPAGSTNISMHQVFGPAPSTPDLILDEATGGPSGIEIMSLEQGKAFEAAIQIGVQFQMNTIYDPVGNLISIYVNGSLTGTKVPNSGIHYNKFGQYVSLSGTGPSTMDWVNISSFAGGVAPGNTPPPNFTINASASSGGSISPTGAVTVNKGASQSFTITPSSGFKVSSVTVDGASQGAITSFTFSNVQANHTISAAFTAVTTTFTITASAGSGGSISPSGSVVVNQGASQSFSITPNTGFTVSSVTVDGASQGAITSFTFSNVQAAHTISAAFAAVPTFTITASAGANGSISPSGSVVVNQGASQAFTITPNSGFAVSSVTVDGANQGAITSFTFTNVQAAHTISAAFTAVTTTFTITASADAGGSISPSGTVTVNSGASQTFTITASAGNTTYNVNVDGVDLGPLATFSFSNVTANHTIIAQFITGNGCLTASVGAPWQNLGLPSSQPGTFEATFDATPSVSPNNATIGISNGTQTAYTGFACIVRFNNLGDIDARNGGAYAAASTIPFSANSTYHFRLEINVPTHTYSIFVTPPGGTELTVGTNFAFRTEQNTVTSLNNWGDFVDNASGGAGNLTTCNFAATATGTTNFTITASAGANGSISPSGSVVVNQGANQAFTITPNSGFAVSAVTVDGVSQGAITSFTFSNVQASHTISASFQAVSTIFTITASAGAGGSISPSGSVVVAQGASQAFTITPNSGSTISAVTVDGANQGAITSFTFSNVQANHTISATFQSTGGGGCLTAGSTWTSAATGTATGTFTATFDATPHASGITAFIGMTNGVQTNKSSSPFLVKFHSTGDLEAANGSNFAATNTINWVNGSTYHFRVVANLSAGTYSVFVTPPGQAEQTLATNFAFQAAASTLNTWGEQDTAASLVVCNFAD